MPQPRRISKLTACGALAAAVTLGCFWATGPFAEGENTTAKVASANSEMGPLPAAIARLLSVGTVAMNTQALALPVAAQPAAISAEIQNVVPSLKHTVSNWREFHPDKITVAPLSGLPIEFAVTSVKEQHGRTVWTGRNTIEGAFLVSAATENEWHAVLAIPEGATFEINITGQTATVTEKIDEGVCGLPLIPQRHTPPRASALALGDTIVSDDPVSNGSVTAGDVSVVDVLFFYDAATLAAVQNTPATFDTRMIANIEASNLTLQNSGVSNLQWRFVASYQVPAYTDTGKMEDDLHEFTYVDHAPGQFAREKSILHGSDVAVLYVAGTRNWAGIAWMPGRHAVVAWNTSFMTLAHEIGHNSGCNHDRVTAEALDGDGRFNYGYRFTNAGRDTGTVMSYASSRVQYFSNPEVSYQGQPLGVPEDQPKAANNARTLRESAASMAGFRAPTSVPVITAHPQSTSAAEGQSLSLSVGATGNALSYQWTKEGAAIAGANFAIYTKTAATPSDAGVYAVIVSNPAGSVTSNSATVTITAPIPAAPASAAPSGDAGGGGGGGGSTGGWFTAAFGFLLLARRMRRGAP